MRQTYAEHPFYRFRREVRDRTTVISPPIVRQCGLSHVRYISDALSGVCAFASHTLTIVPCCARDQGRLNAWSRMRLEESHTNPNSRSFIATKRNEKWLWSVISTRFNPRMSETWTRFSRRNVSLNVFCLAPPRAPSASEGLKLPVKRDHPNELHREFSGLTFQLFSSNQSAQKFSFHVPYTRKN